MVSDSSTLAAAAGLSRRRKRTSGRAPGSFTQSRAKKSDRVCGGGWEEGGRGRAGWGGGDADYECATAARRGSVAKESGCGYEIDYQGRERDVRVGGEVIMRGGVARIRCSALESRGTIGAGFSAG